MAGRRIFCQFFALCSLSILPPLNAEIPWPEVERHLGEQNKKLAQRPRGHDGEYFVVCTVYYTPMESGFTAKRGFDVTLVTKPGLRGRKYPRDFLRAVKNEGFGRIITPVNRHNYIRYDGRNSFEFALHPIGRAGELVPRSSAAARSRQPGFFPKAELITASDAVRDVFETSKWRIADLGGGLHRWQVDLYWGEDEPMGPGKLLARPRGTDFEYAYSEAKLKEPTKAD